MSPYRRLMGAVEAILNRYTAETENELYAAYKACQAEERKYPKAVTDEWVIRPPQENKP